MRCFVCPLCPKLLIRRLAPNDGMTAEVSASIRRGQDMCGTQRSKTGGGLRWPPSGLSPQPSSFMQNPGATKRWDRNQNPPKRVFYINHMEAAVSSLGLIVRVRQPFNPPYSP